MVEALTAAGAVRSPAVVAALGRVPREAFVPRFWSLPAPRRRSVEGDLREWRGDSGDPQVLELVYDIDRALAIGRDPMAHVSTSGVTSTASAPRVVGSMLELLDLRPGMRVLEIGTGSGYNAALLAELVGPEGLVTSVEIDPTLAEQSRARLEASGYGAVNVVAADGHRGVSDHAPYDRVVATVGCVDLAPAWIDQLVPGGFGLIPLQHGGWHPLTRIERDGPGASGVVVGRSGFVAIQGHQAGGSPWPHARAAAVPDQVCWDPLAEDLAAVLRPEVGREAIGGVRAWDLAYLVALEDRRAASMDGLSDGTSSAGLDSGEGRVGYAGPDGRLLRDRILDLASLWMSLGSPILADYHSSFTPLADEVGSDGREGFRIDSGEWQIDRIDYRQRVTLRQGTSRRSPAPTS
jgi:protein-L-isoaspartate(D-aspartate) O-methyltransferase